MSALAKAFVVIVAVLSVVFLGVEATLYQHRTDWKESYDLLKDRYHSLAEISTKEIKTLQSEIKEKKAFINTKDVEVQKLKDELDRIASMHQQEVQDRLSLEDKYNRLQEIHKTIADQIAEKDRYIQQLNVRIDQQKIDLDVAIRDKETAEKQVARLTHIKNGLEHDLEDSRKTLAKTSKTLRDKELMISMLRDKGVDIESLVIGAPPPAIEGVVVAVREIAEDPEHPLVLLSVGKNDKVEKGHQFSIHRGNDFVAKVIVEKVMPDMAGCRVQFFKDGMSISEGDKASTRLP